MVEFHGGAWRATVHGIAKRWTQLSNLARRMRLQVPEQMELKVGNIAPVSTRIWQGCPLILILCSP